MRSKCCTAKIDASRFQSSGKFKSNLLGPVRRNRPREFQRGLHIAPQPPRHLSPLHDRVRCEINRRGAVKIRAVVIRPTVVVRPSVISEIRINVPVTACKFGDQPPARNHSPSDDIRLPPATPVVYGSRGCHSLGPHSQRFISRMRGPNVDQRHSSDNEKCDSGCKKGRRPSHDRRSFVGPERSETSLS